MDSTMQQNAYAAYDERSLFTNSYMGLFLPLAQSAVTGVLIGALFLAIGLWVDVRRPWPMSFLALTVTWCGMWVTAILSWYRAVYPAPLTAYAPEAVQVTMQDAAPQNVRIELHSADNRQVQFLDLPTDAQKLAALAQGVLNGVSLAESNWVGSGKLFQRAEFTELRSTLLQRQIVREIAPGYPARGYALTVAGRHVLKHFAGDTVES